MKVPMVFVVGFIVLCTFSALYAGSSKEASGTARGKLETTTFASSRKVVHIKKNPEVHLTVGVTSMETAESYLQIQGRAEVLTDTATKKAVWNDHLKGIFTGPEDPHYNVIKITPYHIEYEGMGIVPPEVWEA